MLRDWKLEFQKVLPVGQNNCFKNKIFVADWLVHLCGKYVHVDFDATFYDPP